MLHAVYCVLVEISVPNIRYLLIWASVTHQLDNYQVNLRDRVMVLCPTYVFRTSVLQALPIAAFHRFRFFIITEVQIMRT